MTGEVRLLPATPSAIVVLGAALQPSLIYNASGRLESQVALITTAFAATQVSAMFTTPDIARSSLFASATSFAQVDPVFSATTSSLISNLASPSTVVTPPELGAPPLPFIPGAPVATSTITLEPPLTANVVAALSNTFNPLIPGTPDITPLVPGPSLPITLTGVIADPVQTLAGTPNTATFALPPPITAALPTPAGAGAVIPLTAGTTTIAPTGSTIATGPATDGAAIAAQLTQAAVVDTGIVTPALGAAILTSDDIVRNPFYPAMAATLYLSAMIFRLQQSSAAELNSPAENVQMVGGVRAVSGVQFDRQGPADDFRNMTRTFA